MYVEHACMTFHFDDVRHESMESWVGDRHYESLVTMTEKGLAPQIFARALFTQLLKSHWKNQLMFVNMMIIDCCGQIEMWEQDCTVYKTVRWWETTETDLQVLLVPDTLAQNLTTWPLLSWFLVWTKSKACCTYEENGGSSDTKLWRSDQNDQSNCEESVWRTHMFTTSPNPHPYWS